MKRFGIITALMLVLLGGTAFAEVKWYADENSSNQSSWDNNVVAEGVSDAQTSELMYVAKYCDNSSLLPVELNRRINPVTSGGLTVEFAFSLDTSIDGMRFSLLGKSDRAISIVVNDSTLYYEMPDGTLLRLFAITVSQNLDECVHHVRLDVDIDNALLKSIEIDGVKSACDLPFYNDTGIIDSFDVRTSNAGKGTFMVHYLRIYSGYCVNEAFLSKAVPDSFEIDGNVSIREFNYRYRDRNSMEMKSATVTRSFQKVSGKVNFETHILIPEYREDVEISLIGEDTPLLTFIAKNKSFLVNDESFYEFKQNVWYHIKAEIDKNYADIYINGKKALSGVGVKGEYIDSVKFHADDSENTVVIDDVVLNEIAKEPSDYVTQPQKVDTGDYSIGIQMCPLWTEGTHTGWSAIKSTPQREPLIGYYDEGNPEVSDWEIKQMVEHGIDFLLVCAYTCYSKEIENRDPIKSTAIRHGNALHKGYFNAKYSDMLKFAILWENNGYRYGEREYEDFFENLVPFWIEYYFKDERYYKIDGRPFMSVYNPQNFFDLFGKEEEAIKAGIQKFRDICIAEGVGNPIIAVSPSSVYTDELIDKYSSYGIDFAAKYNFGKDGIKTQQVHLNNMKKWNNGNTMGIIPVCVSGFDAIPWGKPGGFKATPDEYKKQLEWIKNEYIPTLPQKEKNVVIAATWNEFGEGTILAPTVSEGYAYLDAIRDTFSLEEGVHEDIVPTEGQKKRINNMTLKSNFNMEIAEKILSDPDTLDVICGWYDKEDFSKWIAGENVKSFELDNSIMRVMPSERSPQIILNDINLDAEDIEYLRIKLKPNSTASDGSVSWTTSMSENFNSQKTKYFSFMEKGYNDIYIPVGNGYMWKGTLKSLKITLGSNISDYSEEIDVELIELVGKSDSNVSIDGYKAVLDADENGMFSLRDISLVLGTDFGHFTYDDTYAVKRNKTVFHITPDSRIVTTDKKSIILDTAPKKHDDMLYISPDTVSQIFGADISKNHIKTGIYDVSDNAREVVYEYDLSDTEGMDFKEITEVTVSPNGILVKSIGKDPYIKLPAFDFEGERIKKIVIGMKSDIASTGELFYMKDGDTNFVSNQVIEFPVFKTDTVYEYSINISQQEDFAGTLTRLRIDPIKTEGNVEIKYIKLLGEAELPDVKLEEVRDSSIALTRHDKLEYSIDGKNWTSGNEFSKLLEGKYKLLWRFKGANKPLGEIEAILGAVPLYDVSVWNGEADTSWYSDMDAEFIIKNASELAGFSKLVNNGKSFKDKTVYLDCDIDLNNISFTAIGGNTRPFKGVFDGGGHIIKNISSQNADDYDFGFIARNEGKIKRLGIENAVMTSNFGYCSSILCARNLGIIEECFVRKSKLKNNTATLNRSGAITAINKGDIKNSYVYNVGLSGEVPKYGFGVFSGTVEGGNCENCYTAEYTTSNAEKTRGFGAFSESSSWKRCYFITFETDNSTVLHSGGASLNYSKDFYMGEAYQADIFFEYNGGYPILEWEYERFLMPSDICADGIVTDKQDSNINSSINIRNNTDTDKTVIMITAFYKDGVCRRIIFDDIPIDKKTTSHVNKTAAAKEEETSVKTFVFYDMKTLKPLVGAKTENLEGGN